MPEKITVEKIIEKADEWIIKELTKLIHRIERILVPSNSLIHSTVGYRLETFIKLIKDKKYFLSYNKIINKFKDLQGCDVKNLEMMARRIDWDRFENDLINTIKKDDANRDIPATVLEEIETERSVHEERYFFAMKKESLRTMQIRNGQPMMPGKWRKEPFPPRQYDKLSSYAVTTNLDEEEVKRITEQLITPLDGFQGQAYDYDDHGLTEEWMVTFKDKDSTGPSDDQVIRTQLESLLEIMKVAVQDRVCTESGVLRKEPVGLGKDLKEVPVWGIDCYTYRMVEIAIEDNVSANIYSEKTVKHFIQRKLLPSINEQPSHLAHDMQYAAKSIAESPSSSNVEIEYANALLTAIGDCGIDVFRIHPKGTGVICTNPDGIPPHTFISEYLGELYPPYRWCERLNVIEQAQKTFELKPTLPDFYNILLERPRHDPNGYGLLYVDASQRANMGSSCSHSCEANCTSAVVARNGKLVIALTTNRYVHYGEELTMDYYSITTSETEWRAAICLCGAASCRGSFLHYATQDDLQQVLNNKCSPLWRYASLLRACSGRPLSSEDQSALDRHGMQSAALGSSPPVWIQKYAAENLRFIEYERKALPCALMRNSLTGSKASGDNGMTSYTFSTADMDARSVMEQRIQSLVCCVSMVQKVVNCDEDADNNLPNKQPLATCLQTDAVNVIWKYLTAIPDLLKDYLLEPAILAVEKAEVAVTVKISDLEQKKSNESVAKLALNELLKSSKSPTKSPATTPTVEMKMSPNFIENKDDNDIVVVQQPNEEDISLKKAKSAVRCATAAVSSSTTNLKTVEAALQKAKGNVEEIDASLLKIQHFFNKNEQPKGLSKLREFCLNLRELLIAIEHLSTSVARIGLLADLIIMWAFTSNFSTAQKFPVVESQPVTVVARELGNNIPRNKISSNIQSEDQMQLSSDEPAVEKNQSLASDSPVIDVNIKKSTTTDRAISDEPSGSVMLPNEPVFEGRMQYSSEFTFWQLMGWFNTGTDQEITAPDLFGCVALPEPSQCFGINQSGEYKVEHREALVKQIEDDKSQTMPWPDKLKGLFSEINQIEVEQRTVLYGSPMLDGALGKVDSVSKCLEILKTGLHSCSTIDIRKGSRKSNNKGNNDDDIQFDNILPPEQPTAWVQCESCHKWRRVAWHVDSTSLPDLWECTMNTWDPENATCSAPQDSFDPDKESTLAYQAHEPLAIDPSSFTKGKWFDLFCNTNKVYYEAQVKQIKAHKSTKSRPTGPVKALFHFKGWSSRFDEWVPIDSDRIKIHNLHTNPDMTDPREQEIWQGMYNVAEQYNKIDDKKNIKTTKKVINDNNKSKNSGRKRANTNNKSSNSNKRVKNRSNVCNNSVEVYGLQFDSNNTDVTNEYLDDFIDLDNNNNSDTIDIENEEDYLIVMDTTTELSVTKQSTTKNHNSSDSTGTPDGVDAIDIVVDTATTKNNNIMDTILVTEAAKAARNQPPINNDIE